MERTKSVFVIIVTYNGAKWIKECLISLQESSFHVKVIVVDNQSRDQTVSIVIQNFPNVDLVIANSNVGFGKANNIGIKKALNAGAEYIFLLNQDAWLEKGLLEKIIDIHIQNPDYGILAPVQINKERTRIDNKFLYYMYTTDNILSDIYFKNEKDIYTTEFANAAAWLISRSCIEKVGLFDPFFFHYSEDRNFCHRTIYHGYKIGICPQLMVIHDRENRKITEDKNELRKMVFREEIANLLDIRKDNFERGYKIKKHHKIKLLAKSFLKFNIDEFIQTLNELWYLKKNRSSMVKSFETNRVGGSAYLKV